MTIKEIISKVDRARPNSFSDEEKVKWIAELDGKIALNVMLMDIAEVAQFQYCVENMNVEPLVRFPHDDIYELWLYAKIDFENGEYGKYQNSMEMYNEHYGAFVRWFGMTYAPAQMNNRRCGDGWK